MVILNTGQGKGKSTSAFGQVLRAWGNGLRVCVIQFIKSSKGRWGETKAAERLGIEWHAMGEGFTWLTKDAARDAARAREGWAFAQSKIASGEYDLVVLDEFTYPCKYGWLDTREVVAWLGEHKPSAMHLVVTGRDAPPELIDYADVVTDMRNVKHPHDSGRPAQRGVEF
jgi:cob(I)alamin adenosyltransferase